MGVGESRETAYNRVVILPYGAGKDRKNARKFYFFISSLQVAIIAEAVRWHYAIVVAYAEKDRKTQESYAGFILPEIC